MLGSLRSRTDQRRTNRDKRSFGEGVGRQGIHGHLSSGGGPRGTRTHNQRVKSPLLCQLS